MDFTREPIIETVITPKEGCTLVVRSSKSLGQEEYFVDAVEMVSFGNSVFFRSRERPKAFLVPVSDYEILEVRETRLVLKNAGLDRSIKIGGGREASLRSVKEPMQDKSERSPKSPEEPVATESAEVAASPQQEPRPQGSLDKKRDRKRNYKRRKGREELPSSDVEGVLEEDEVAGEGKEAAGASKDLAALSGAPAAASANAGVPVFSSLLPPPANLISETIARYKENALFQGAFFLKEDLSEKKISSSEISGEIDQSDLPLIKEGQIIDEDSLGEKIMLPNISLDYPRYLPPLESAEVSEKMDKNEEKEGELLQTSFLPLEETKEEMPVGAKGEEKEISSEQPFKQPESSLDGLDEGVLPNDDGFISEFVELPLDPDLAPIDKHEEDKKP